MGSRPGQAEEWGGGRTDFCPYPKLEMPGGPGPSALLSYLGSVACTHMHSVGAHPRVHSPQNYLWSTYSVPRSVPGTGDGRELEPQGQPLLHPGPTCWDMSSHFTKQAGRAQFEAAKRCSLNWTLSSSECCPGLVLAGRTHGSGDSGGCVALCNPSGA